LEPDESLGAEHELPAVRQRLLGLFSVKRPLVVGSDDARAFAEERVLAGDYASVEDVANAAVKLLRQRDRRLREARDELQTAFAEMGRGTYLEPTDDEFARAVHERALKHMV
jgi:Arc/MetJ-type ribon-helix-helix transcriptional regulator